MGRLQQFYSADNKKLAAHSRHLIEVRPVRRSRYFDEQIAAALRQSELGTPIAELTGKVGVSEATFYVCNKRFGKLGTPEIRELRQLRGRQADRTASECHALHE